MRYELNLRSCMSDDGMVEREDSEAGCYSDGERDYADPDSDDGSPNPRTRRTSRIYFRGRGAPSPPLSLSDAESVDSPRPVRRARSASPTDPVWLTPD